jgi:hypothetical protein
MARIVRCDKTSKVPSDLVQKMFFAGEAYNLEFWAEDCTHCPTCLEEVRDAMEWEDGSFICPHCWFRFWCRRSDGQVFVTSTDKPGGPSKPGAK